MKIQLVRSKIHRAIVTGGNLNYPGSITLGENLLKAARIIPYELVHVNNLSNAAHWETYVIPGRAGEVILNGAPSRLFELGDLVIIMALVELDPHPENLRSFKHRSVYVLDDKNVRLKTTVEEIDLDEWQV